MKELFKIFVEGDADKRFISQLLEFLFKTSIDQGNIIKTSGWNCLVSPKTEIPLLHFLRKRQRYMPIWRYY